MIVIDPTSGGAAGVTFDNVIDRTLRLLGGRDNINVLRDDVNLIETTIHLGYSLQGIERGSVLSVNNEIMYVWDVAAPSGDLTVGRGYRGSEIASHAAGDIVTVDPRFPRYDVGLAVNDELRALSSRGLYQVKTADLVWNVSRIGYDVGDPKALDVIEVRVQMPASFHEWPRLSSSDWRISHKESTVEFPSGVALFVFNGGYPGRLMRLVYKAGFNELVSGEDDVQSVAGLHVEASDILSLGAAVRLVAPLEIERNNIFSEGDTRRPGEVPPGALLRSASALIQEREQRIREEGIRLQRQFPLRKGGW